MNDAKYNLEERTAKFGIQILTFSKKIPINAVSKPLINQIVRSGTSIGANYSEANQTITRKDFINKIVICKKESNETKYWLRMIAESNEPLKEDCRKLWTEANELTLIFSKAVKTARINDNKP